MANLSADAKPLGKFIAATVLIVLVSSVFMAASSNTYMLKNNVPGFVRKAVNLGPVDPSTVISVTVWLNLRNENQLNQLVQQQYTKGSANFHKWITQDQFNTSYAPTASDVKSLTNFLQAHNLAVLAIAENNFFVKVQGTIGDISKTFKVTINNYSYNGSTYRSNGNDPTVNDGSGAHVAAITGMDDFGFQPALVRATDADGNAVRMPLSSVTPGGVFFEGQCFRGVETHTFTSSSATATYTGNRYGADITNTSLGHLAPCGYSARDIQTAYNMSPLYSAGLNGAGETIVIVDAYGSSTIEFDADVYSQVMGLPRITSSNFQIVKAPGISNNPHGVARTWDIETTLDVELAHALAPGANIALLLATDHASLDEAINYAVVHHLGNTISNSWSTIEGLGNPAQFDRDNRILLNAAAVGIDVNFATGDFGDETTRVGFKTVDFPASSPFATAVGGTSVALNANRTIAWQTGWGTNLTRIAGTIAEGSPPVVPPLHLGFQSGAGGGSSLIFAKPSFQSGIPGTTRQTPDIGMLADPFTGAEIIQTDTSTGQLFVEVIGGTSLATPLFSAVMSVAAQKAQHGLGQAAPLLYGLGSGIIDVTPFTSATNVSGTITTSSGTTVETADDLAQPLDGVTTYFSAIYNSPFSTRWFALMFGTDTSLKTTVGYDNVTGIGSPDGANFVNALVP